MKQEATIVAYQFESATEDQRNRIEWIEYHARALAVFILAYAPAGPDQDAAIRRLRESVLSATVAIASEPDTDKLEEIQANAFTDFFTRTLPSLFGKLFTPDQTKQIAIGISNFVKTNIGKLAVDAVEYVDTLPPFSSDVDKRDAAVAKLKEDAAAAGDDLSTYGKAFFNWAIETALQWVLTKGLTAAVTAVTAAA